MKYFNDKIVPDICITKRYLPTASERPLRLSDLVCEVTTVEEELSFLAALKSARRNPAQRIVASVFSNPARKKIEREMAELHVRELKELAKSGPMTSTEFFEKTCLSRGCQSLTDFEERYPHAASRRTPYNQELVWSNATGKFEEMPEHPRIKRAKAHKSSCVKYPSMKSLRKVALKKFAKLSANFIVPPRTSGFNLKLRALPAGIPMSIGTRAETPIPSELADRLSRTGKDRVEPEAIKRYVKPILKMHPVNSLASSPPRPEKKVRFALD